MAHNMLHMTSAQSVAHDLHVVAPGCLSMHVGDSSRGSEEIVKDLELCMSV